MNGSTRVINRTKAIRFHFLYYNFPPKKARVLERKDVTAQPES
jgi:hypothetical protein